MSNNLIKFKQDLRAFAKKCKNVHYSDGLLITFLITGMVFISNNLFSDSINSSIDNQKQAISTSIKDMRQTLSKTRNENNKLLKNTNLELTQLIEQGDYVVKSPWSSWQFGINYFYNDWNASFKGRGDKEEKYPFEGVFERSTNEYERNISTSSSNYSLLSKSKNPTSASSNARTGLSSSYGLASTDPVAEPLVSFEVSAGINPKGIDKQPLNIQAKTANAVTTPDPVRFNPINPNIVVPKDPALPQPPTFAVVLGADCNNGGIGAAGCNSDNNTPRQDTKADFLTNGLNNRSLQNVSTTLHYTWPGTNGVTNEAGSLAFKMWQDERANFSGTPDTIYFNSYNYSYNGGVNEYQNSVASSLVSGKNSQYFFVGGSRFIEIDNQYGSTYQIPSNKTINLGGILTLGMVSQQNTSTLENLGTITDIYEKDEEWIKNMPTDTGQNYLTIKGPTTDYKIKKSADGYVGYKVGIAQVQENGGTHLQPLTN